MSQENSIKRSNSIDILKAIAALMVCYQHACGQGVIAEYLLAFARVAVPLFVMVTGYFYRGTVEKHREFKQIKKFFFIAVGMVALYFFIDCANHLLTHDLVKYLSNFCKLPNVLAFVLFNDPINADHSWYMWAMIYVLLFLYIAPSLWKKKISRYIIVFTTVIGLPLLSKYVYLFDDNIKISSDLYRNFLIPVAAYFILGIILSEHKEFIQKMGSKKWAVIVIAAVVLISAEKTVFQLLGIHHSKGSFFFTPLLAIAIFSYFLNFNHTGKVAGFFANFGRKYSLMFYVIHPIFVRFEVKIFNMKSWQQYLGYFTVVICTYVFVVLFYKAKDFVKSNFMGRKYETH